MPAAASEDLRIRVVNAYFAGEGTYEQIATRFSVGTASVSRWLRIRRETGSVQPKSHGGGMPSRIDGAGLEMLAEFVRAKPDITLAELADKYAGRTETRVALSIMCRALKRLGLVRKKR